MDGVFSPMLVQDLMSTGVVTVPLNATVQDAAGQLLEHGVGSVIIVNDDGGPVGILTETDIIKAGYRSEQPFSDIDVADVGHKPVIKTKPSASISLVADKMANNDVKKVPVMDDMDLVGIITLSDIVWHLSDIRKEASELERAGKKWGPNDD
jgi:CBS domain-containing protein